MNPDAMHVLVEYEGATPYLYFFKYGLVEEKVVSVCYLCIGQGLYVWWGSMCGGGMRRYHKVTVGLLYNRTTISVK